MPELLDAIEIETAREPDAAVIWMHGLGDDGRGWSEVVPSLGLPAQLAIRFVFPHAPVTPVTINNGMRMRAWYDIRNFSADELAGGDRADSAGVLESVMQVEALLAREAGRGVPPSRIVLAGFSQGGAIALSTALRRAQPLAGVVALSTYLPMAPQAAQFTRHEALAQPVFMAHGSADPVVPPRAGEHSAQVLRSLGLDVAWHAYPMGHAVCAEEIRDLGDWLERRFAAATDG